MILPVILLTMADIIRYSYYCGGYWPTILNPHRCRDGTPSTLPDSDAHILSGDKVTFALHSLILFLQYNMDMTVGGRQLFYWNECIHIQNVMRQN